MSGSENDGNGDRSGDENMSDGESEVIEIPRNGHRHNNHSH